MCGIAGILRFDGQPIARDDLRRTLDRLAHRGRDHFGMAVGEVDGLSSKASIALGHRRLSIIDLSEGASQPMSYNNRQLWLSFNGEIYNYRELRHDLRGRGYRFATESDTEVILASYSEWGDKCVERLNGMFAFALWDEERGRLLCARDQLGVKPFYYIKSDKFFAFASESRALVHYHGNGISTDALAAYLLGMYVPAEWSIFRDVKKLLPGHTMALERSGESRLTRYWTIRNVGDKDCSPDERKSLDGLLRSAVARQLRSDVPVGALLSGGVDSGLIVALASKEGARLDTYSVGFEGQAESELPAAAEIAGSFGTNHHETLITASEAVSRLDASIACLSEPVSDPAIVPSYVLAEMAAADGVKVLLSGTGGDEVFGGYDRYIGSSLRRRLFSFAPEWARMATGHLLSPSSKLGARLRNTSLDMLFTTGGDFNLCAAALQGTNRLDKFFDSLSSAVPEVVATDQAPLLYRQMGFDLGVYLPDEILFLLDQMTMAHTIEGRVPLLDVNVVEAAFRLRPGCHVSNHKTKILLRQIAADYLGESHVWRKKQGFAGPVPWWVGENLKLFREAAIASSEIPGMESVGPEIKALCQRDRTPDRRRAHALFILYCLRRWYDSLNSRE